MYNLLLVTALLTGASDTVPLYTNLGNYSHAISTRVPKAQQYFDQGLRLAYGFNHDEAIRAFRRGGAAGPEMRDLLVGRGVQRTVPNINLPMDSAMAVAAWEALGKAQSLIANALTGGAGLHPRTGPALRRESDGESARSETPRMRVPCRRRPEAIRTISMPRRCTPKAMMDLRPWNYWQKDGSPYPGTADFVATLERVLRTRSEPSGRMSLLHPRSGGGAAGESGRLCERLASLMPGAGHLVHMPAHILHPRRPLERCDQSEQTRGTRRPDVHRRPKAQRPVPTGVLPAQPSFPGIRRDHGGPERAGDRARASRSPQHPGRSGRRRAGAAAAGCVSVPYAGDVRPLGRCTARTAQSTGHAAGDCAGCLRAGRCACGQRPRIASRARISIR